MSSALFNDVLNQLMALGRPKSEPIDYISVLGLSLEHWDVLQKITTDDDELYNSEDEDDNKFYATIHAGYALFQLDALAATPILISQFYKSDVYEDEWIDLYMNLMRSVDAQVLPMIYPEISANLAKGYDGAASRLVEVIENIARHASEDIHASIISVAEDLLANYQQQEELFNSAVIGLLVTCHSVNSIELIRDVFKANKAELLFMGDIEEVEIELGLRTKRDTPKRNYAMEFMQQNTSSAEQKEHFLMDFTDDPFYQQPFMRAEPKIGRNDLCPCGSGKKYKKCCLSN